MVTYRQTGHPKRRRKHKTTIFFPTYMSNASFSVIVAPQFGDASDDGGELPMLDGGDAGGTLTDEDGDADDVLTKEDALSVLSEEAALPVSVWLKPSDVCNGGGDTILSDIPFEDGEVNADGSDSPFEGTAVIQLILQFNRRGIKSSSSE